MPVDPTPQQILEAMPLVDGRVSIAWNEIIRLLKTNLPGAVDLLNTQLNLTGDKKIKAPKNVRVAPDEITDDDINQILVGMTCQKVPIGTRQFKSAYTVEIYAINERLVLKELVDAQNDLSGPISGILYYTLSGWGDPQNREVWQKMAPIGKQGLPEKYSAYMGFTLIYEMWQNPGANTWT